MGDQRKLGHRKWEIRKWEIRKWEIRNGSHRSGKEMGSFPFFLPLVWGVECYLANLNSNKGCWRIANANK